MTYLIENSYIKDFYAQKIYYDYFEGNILSYYKKKFVKYILLSGSNVRRIVEKIIKR